jgi:hypothetical protein
MMEHAAELLAAAGRTTYVRAVGNGVRGEAHGDAAEMVYTEVTTQAGHGHPGGMHDAPRQQAHAVIFALAGV